MCHMLKTCASGLGEIHLFFIPETHHKCLRDISFIPATHHMCLWYMSFITEIHHSSLFGTFFIPETNHSDIGNIMFYTRYNTLGSWAQRFWYQKPITVVLGTYVL